MQNFVYILLCADGTLYTGWTTDLTARLQAHNSGNGAKYTRARLPVRMVYYEGLADRKAAQQREWAIKQLSRANKIQLICEKRRLSWEQVQNRDCEEDIPLILSTQNNTQ